MRRILFPVYILALLSACAAPVTSVPTIAPTEIPVTPTALAASTPQMTATPTPFFTVYGDKPVVSNGEDGAWDDRFTDPGAVIYYDGMFHMFRNGFRGFPAESQVGYVTSTDGYTWTKQGEDPVFETKDIPYAKIAMYASSVLWQDGCWELYFYTWDSRAFPSSSVIGRTTQCIGGPALTDWMPDPEPLLKPGAEGDWDDKQVLAPDVLQTDDGYIMYYSGVDASGVQMVGMATSTDRVTWTKYNDPTTTDKPFANSDPVFQRNVEKGKWDSGWVHQPRVFQTTDGWVMFYRGTKDKNGLIMKLGIATSEDGIHWERSPLNPILKPSDANGAQYFWFTNVIFHDDTYYLFWEVDKNKSTEIYLATHEGSVMP